MPELDLTALLEARTQLDHLRVAGWAIGGPAGLITATHGPADLRSLVDAIAPLASATTELRFYYPSPAGDLALTLVGSQLEVQELPNLQASDFFEDHGLRSAADRLWSGDASGAHDLPLTWQANAVIALDRLVTTPSELELRVDLHAEALRQTYAAADLGVLRTLIPRTPTRRVHVALDGKGSFHTGQLTFLGIDQPRVVVPEVSVPFEAPDTEHVPSVHSLGTEGNTQDVGESWAALAEDLRNAASSAAWCHLATSVDQAGSWSLNFVGFRKLTLALPQGHRLTGASATPTLDLYQWVFGDPSPDRLLATRRVASLYDGPSLLDSGSDVKASAEVVFVGLRNDVVAEVLKASRDAEAQVLEVVRQTARGTQDLLKSVTDRTIAALIAIGGVLIANSSKAISQHVARELLLLVAAFLVVLAVWSVLIEGPLLGAAMGSVFQDLRSGTALVTKTHMERLEALSSVTRMKGQVCRVRVSIPVFYVVIVALIWFFGKPSLYT